VTANGAHGHVCAQVMLVVESQGEPGAAGLPGWQGLSVEAVAADRGDAVPTDLVVSIALRYEAVDMMFCCTVGVALASCA
jgi:hypothetical protein